MSEEKPSDELYDELIQYRSNPTEPEGLWITNTISNGSNYKTYNFEHVYYLSSKVLICLI